MEKQPDQRKINILKFFARLALALTGVILFFYTISPVYFRFFLPLLKHEMEILHPEYTVIDYDIQKIRQLNYLYYLVRVDKEPVGDAENATGKKGSIMKLKGQASTLTTAPIIIFSLILAWPGLTIRQRFKSMGVSIPLIILIACVDYPLIFITEIESVYSSGTMLNSFRLLWKHLLNNGGRQFLALVAFLIVIAPIYISNPSFTPQNKVGRNDPCPCGSGRKFKHCCLE